MSVELEIDIVGSNNRDVFRLHASGINGFVVDAEQSLYYDPVDDVNFTEDWRVAVYVPGGKVLDYDVPRSSDVFNGLMRNRLRTLYEDFLINPSCLTQYRARQILNWPFLGGS